MNIGVGEGGGANLQAEMQAGLKMNGLGVCRGEKEQQNDREFA
jgi:hypothetical protein